MQVLGLERCRFDYGTGLDHPRLEHDGSVVRRGEALDVDADGLPQDRPTELIVESGGQFWVGSCSPPAPAPGPPEPSGWSRPRSPTRQVLSLVGYEAGRPREG